MRAAYGRGSKGTLMKCDIPDVLDSPLEQLAASCSAVMSSHYKQNVVSPVFILIPGGAAVIKSKGVKP